MTKAPSARRLRVPVRFVDGVWECTWGGTVPVKSHTEAVLVVERRSVSDRAFREAMERRGRYKVLDEGTRLLVCMTIKPEGRPAETLASVWKSYDNFRGAIATHYLDYWNPGTMAFVEVSLGGPNDRQARILGTDRGGLWLMTEGIEAVGLASTTVILPKEISLKPVASLNHAFTKLSENLETWRISHTGNIYTRVLYQERSGTWYPLDILRNMALAMQEQEIAHELWKDFMASMSVVAGSGVLPLA